MNRDEMIDNIKNNSEIIVGNNSKINNSLEIDGTKTTTTKINNNNNNNNNVHGKEDVVEGKVKEMQGKRALVTGAGGTAYSSANAHIGVGDSSAAADASQTDLQGANKKWNPMDAGYPTSTNQKATWRASFADGDANFTWNEWGVCNASGTAAGGTLLNRKVENLGTKNGGTWQLTVEISLS